jgi:hypothetical protein
MFLLQIQGQSIEPNADIILDELRASRGFADRCSSRRYQDRFKMRKRLRKRLVFIEKS